MKKSSIFLLSILLINNVFSQRHCGAKPVSDSSIFLKKAKLASQFLDKDDIYRVPVVVHVVHNELNGKIGFGDNISDEQIFSQIEVLNEDFRRKNSDTTNTPFWIKDRAIDMQVEFFLAEIDPQGKPTNGITRHYTTKSFYTLSNLDDVSLKKIGYWPSDQYLNIWVARLETGYIGYAQFPNGSGLQGTEGYQGSNETDGLVITPLAFGRNTGTTLLLNNPYRLGRTTVHEIGHWLGLLHTFDDSDFPSCFYSDYCNDTPTQDESSLDLDDCSKDVTNKCSNRTLFQNYMDYSRDRCMNLFTLDQKERVHTAILNAPLRQALRSSQALCGNQNKWVVPHDEIFTAEDKLWDLRGSNYSVNSNDLIINPSEDSVIFETPIFLNLKENKNLFYLKTKSLSSGQEIEWEVFINLSCSKETKLLTKWVQKSGNEEFTLDLGGQLIEYSSFVKLIFKAVKPKYTIVIDELKIFKTLDKLEVNIYPNPNKGDILTIDLTMPFREDIELIIYSVSGQIVTTYNLSDITYSGVYSLNLPQLSPGMYLLKFISSKNEVVKKLFVE